MTAQVEKLLASQTTSFLGHIMPAFVHRTMPATIYADINECAGSPCGAYASCSTPNVNSFKCTCADGYCGGGTEITDDCTRKWAIPCTFLLIKIGCNNVSTRCCYACNSLPRFLCAMHQRRLYQNVCKMQNGRKWHAAPRQRCVRVQGWSFVNLRVHISQREEPRLHCYFCTLAQRSAQCLTLAHNSFLHKKSAGREFVPCEVTDCGGMQACCLDGKYGL